jgi:hypothetical protein
MIDGSSIIALMTWASGVSAVIALSFTPASFFLNTSNGRRPVFFISRRSESSVNGLLK